MSSKSRVSTLPIAATGGIALLAAVGVVSVFMASAGLSWLQAADAGAMAASEARKSGSTSDPEAIARTLVNQCARIKENDRVVVTGGVRDLELLESIVVNARKAGAFPLLTINGDRLARRLIADVPAKYDAQPRTFEQKLAEMIDATITVDFSESDGALADLPPARLAANAQAGAPIGEVMLKRGVRQVNLGNGLYPTASLAKRFGISQDELSRIFWEGVSVDYTKLQERGKAVRKSLREGSKVHITTPDGTDLKVNIAGRPVLISDGIISDEDAKKGGAACQTWLPAGEVYLAPVPGTAEGTVAVDRQYFQGKEIIGLKLKFKGGKLTSMTADSGLEPLKALYAASGPGKDAFAVIDIGINPRVRIPEGSRMQTWVAAGMVTVGLGANDWAGGDNAVPFAVYCFLPRSTLKVDGKAIVAQGSLEP